MIFSEFFILWLIYCFFLFEGFAVHTWMDGWKIFLMKVMESVFKDHHTDWHTSTSLSGVWEIKKYHLLFCFCACREQDLNKRLPPVFLALTVA